MTPGARVLRLSSPPMQGDDVRQLQAALAAKGWYTGELDGVYGELTGQAVQRGKFWLGYRASSVDKTAGALFWQFVDGDKKQTPAMLALTRRRMVPPTTVPLRAHALIALTAKIGVKEDPPGSNISWASLWYMGVTEEWARQHWTARHPGPPWCAMGVCWAYDKSGSTTLALARARERDFAYVPYLVNSARAGRDGLTLTTDPQPGDLACYDWPGESRGLADHVGLFERWASGSRDAFSAVEANTAVGNDSNGGEVMRRNRVRSQVQAFVHVAA